MALPASHVVDVDESAPLLDPSKREYKPTTLGTTSESYTSEYETYQQSHHANLRQAFIRRVYGILCAQLLLNVLVVAMCMYQPAVRDFCLLHPVLVIWGSIIPTFLCLFGMFAFKDRYPINGILLMTFTFFESMALGEVCAIYQSNGLGGCVLQAFGITLAIFGCLTAFAMQSKVDFSFLGGFLSIGLFTLIGWGMLQMIFGWHQLWLYSWIGAILFSGFVLFDTWMIMQRYGYDDYLLAAVELYLDFINLFLNILRILGGNDNR